MSAEMVAVKISRLEGRALDYAVSKAADYKPFFIEDEPGESYWASQVRSGGYQEISYGGFSPSTYWDQCGPLIEELQMNFATLGGQCRNRSRRETNPPLRIVAMPGIADRYHSMDGPTHLIAACRCYVLAKMSMDSDGEVMVPAALVTQ